MLPSKTSIFVQYCASGAHVSEDMNIKHIMISTPAAATASVKLTAAESNAQNRCILSASLSVTWMSVCYQDWVNIGTTTASSNTILQFVVGLSNECIF